MEHLYLVFKKVTWQWHHLTGQVFCGMIFFPSPLTLILPLFFEDFPRPVQAGVGVPNLLGSWRAERNEGSVAMRWPLPSLPQQW